MLKSHALIPVLLMLPSLALAQSCFFERLTSQLASLAPPKTGLVTTIGSPEATVASEMRKTCQSLDSVLTRFFIPVKMRKYYDAEGRFRYRPEQPVRLSAENGDEKLSIARIHYDMSGGGIERQLLIDYVNVLNQLPGTRLWILVNYKRDLKRWIEKLPKTIRSQVEVTETYSGVDRLSLWAQDGSKPISASGPSTKHVLAPFKTEKEHYAVINDQLLEHGQSMTQSPFRFAGGNLVVGEKHVFVGPDVVHMAMLNYGISRVEAMDALTAEFGKPVIEISYKTLPTGRYKSIVRGRLDFHIDLNLAVVRNRKTGRETVLIQSPASAILTLMGKRDRASLPAEWDKFCEALVQGAKQDPHSILTAGEKALIKTLQRMSPNDILIQEDQAKEIAKSLAAKGYEVQFVPGISQIESKRIDYVWEIFNYTNSIFSGNHAIIPDLGIPALDAAFNKQISNLGYNPITVKSPRLSLAAFGGIRCMTQTYRYPVGQK